MKLLQHEIDETISFRNNEKLFRKNTRGFIFLISIFLAGAWILSEFSIIFLIIELIFIGVYIGWNIYLKKSAKENKSACAFYQVLKGSTFSMSTLLVSINAILLLDSSIAGIMVVIVVVVVYSLTIFKSFKTVMTNKNKEFEIKEDSYHYWKLAGSSLGIIVFWSAKGLISKLRQEQAILVCALCTIYISFAIIPNIKRAYRLYLEWKEK